MDSQVPSGLPTFAASAFPSSGPTGFPSENGKDYYMGYGSEDPKIVQEAKEKPTSKEKEQSTNASSWSSLFLGQRKPVNTDDSTEADKARPENMVPDTSEEELDSSSTGGQRPDNTNVQALNVSGISSFSMTTCFAIVSIAFLW
jgi:hypothetical protein